LPDQPSHSWGQLGTIALPKFNSIKCNAERLLSTRSNRVVEADTLNEATIPSLPGVRNHETVERALLGTTAGKSNHDHDVSFKLKIVATASARARATDGTVA
jgi:hypothetical protein